jgi:hypothetical protein
MAFEALMTDYLSEACITYGILRIAAVVGVKRQIDRLCKIHQVGDCLIQG